jgi:hypothetical protein
MEANEVAAASETAMTPPSAIPFAQSGTTQARFASRQSSHV